MGVFKKFSRDELSGGRLVYVGDYGCEIHMVYHMDDGSEMVHRMYLSDDRVFESEDIEVISKDEVCERRRWMSEVISG